GGAFTRSSPIATAHLGQGVGQQRRVGTVSPPAGRATGPRRNVPITGAHPSRPAGGPRPVAGRAVPTTGRELLRAPLAWTRALEQHPGRRRSTAAAGDAWVTHRARKVSSGVSSPRRGSGSTERSPPLHVSSSRRHPAVILTTPNAPCQIGTRRSAVPMEVPPIGPGPRRAAEGETKT